MPEGEFFIGVIFQRRLHPWNKASAETRNKTIFINTENDLVKMLEATTRKYLKVKHKVSDKSLVKFLPSGKFTSRMDVARWLQTN